MLHVRRRPGERTVVFNKDLEVWIEVVNIDPGLGHVKFKLTINRDDGRPLPHETRMSVTMLVGKIYNLPCELRAEMLLMDVTTMNPPPHQCTLGFKAPRDVLIKREETIPGSQRSDRRRMTR